MKTLDASHKTVLENLDTLERAQRCLEEIKAYRWEILQEVADELTAKYDPPLRFVLERGGWIEAKVFPNSEGTDRHLINVGIEHLEVPSIINADAEGCRAYIFSELLADSKAAGVHKAIAQRLRQLQPPSDFTPASAQAHGYLFVKMLGNIPVDAFCSRSRLKSYFETPLTVLADWLRSVSPAVTALKQSARSSAANQKANRQPHPQP